MIDKEQMIRTSLGMFSQILDKDVLAGFPLVAT